MLHDRSHMYYLLRSRCSRAQTRGGRSVHIDIVAVCCTLDAHWAGAVVHASHTPVCTHIRTHTPPRAHAHTPIHTHIQIIGYRAAKHCDIRNKAYNNDFFLCFHNDPTGSAKLVYHAFIYIRIGRIAYLIRVCVMYLICTILITKLITT